MNKGYEVRSPVSRDEQEGYDLRSPVVKEPVH
jgi:hypothetical protein